MNEDEFIKYCVHSFKVDKKSLLRIVIYIKKIFILWTIRWKSIAMPMHQDMVMAMDGLAKNILMIMTIDNYGGIK